MIKNIPNQSHDKKNSSLHTALRQAEKQHPGLPVPLSVNAWAIYEVVTQSLSHQQHLYNSKQDLNRQPMDLPVHRSNHWAMVGHIFG